MNISNPIYRRKRRGFSKLYNYVIQPPGSPDPTEPVSITGTITGPVIEGVIVYLLNSVTRQIVKSGVSNSLGEYTLPNLEKGVSYDILPVVNDHIFTPHLSQVVLSENVVFDFLSVAGGQYLYDSTTISIVDSSNNRLWEELQTNLSFPYTFPITLTEEA